MKDGVDKIFGGINFDIAFASFDLNAFLYFDKTISVPKKLVDVNIFVDVCPPIPDIFCKLFFFVYLASG